MPTTHLFMRRLPRRSGPHRRRTHRGHVLIFSIVIFSVMVGFCSFGVDLGHAQMVKEELESACVAAARYGAAGLAVSPATATANAIAAAAANNADGYSVTITSSNVVFGTWNTTNRTFTVLTGSAQSGANAIKVTCARTAAQGNAVNLSFASIIDHKTLDITVSNICMVTLGSSQTQYVAATSNPFLAGEPSGTEAGANNPNNSPDYAPAESPVQFTGVSVTPGQGLTFTNISGAAGNNGPGGGTFPASGNANDVETNYDGNEHHLASPNAPLNAVMGVFLTNSVPDNNSTPASLDFSTLDEQNFTTLSPLCQQIFFIGDGTNQNGVVQQFVVPSGATRLYLATWDGYQWNNNPGGFTVTTTNNPTMTLVQ